jgi:hypothetical protein
MVNLRVFHLGEVKSHYVIDNTVYGDVRLLSCEVHYLLFGGGGVGGGLDIGMSSVSLANSAPTPELSVALVSHLLISAT